MNTARSIWRGSITVFECARREPTALLALVPDAWLGSIAPTASVWEQLYRWLADAHGADGIGTLHSRTFVGGALMLRLVAAERKRLARRGVPRREIAGRVAWSNCGSGPMESHDGWRLTGDALFWVPYSDAWMRSGAPVPSEPALATRYVYALRAGESGRIKIGTARDVAARMAQLQTGCPEPLVLLAKVPGGPALESALHARFAQHRRVGEWFEPTPDLLALIDSLNGRG